MSSYQEKEQRCERTKPWRKRFHYLLMTSYVVTRLLMMNCKLIKKAPEKIDNRFGLEQELLRYKSESTKEWEVRRWREKTHASSPSSSGKSHEKLSVSSSGRQQCTSHIYFINSFIFCFFLIFIINFFLLRSNFLGTRLFHLLAFCS